MRLGMIPLLCMLLLCESYAIPWPLGDGTSNWESIYPVMHTYGNFDENAFWAAVDENFTEYTFHNAIDLSWAQTNTETIRAVEDGLYTDCLPVDSTLCEWYTHIFPVGSGVGCEINNQLPTGVYVCCMSAGDVTQLEKIVVTR